MTDSDEQRSLTLIARPKHNIGRVTPPQETAPLFRYGKISKAALTEADRQRKQLSVNAVFHRYSDTDATPLGSDHKAVVLQHVASQQANAAACAVLDRSITLADAYRRARELLQQGDEVAAAAVLTEAKVLRDDEQRLQKQYDSAAAVHLATMVHLLNVALVENARRKAHAELAQSIFAPFVSAEQVRTEATQAPADRQHFVATAEAPPLATGDAGAAPPVRIISTDLASSPSTEAQQGGDVEP